MASEITQLTVLRYEKAAELFQLSINLAQVTQCSEIAWATLYVNLGTCFRTLKSVNYAF